MHKQFITPEHLIKLRAVPCTNLPGDKPCIDVDDVWAKCEPCRAYALASNQAYQQNRKRALA